MIWTGWPWMVAKLVRSTSCRFTTSFKLLSNMAGSREPEMRTTRGRL